MPFEDDGEGRLVFARSNGNKTTCKLYNLSRINGLFIDFFHRFCAIF